MKKKLLVILVLISMLMSGIGFALPSKWAQTTIFSTWYEGVVSEDLYQNKNFKRQITREEFADLAVRVYSKASGVPIDRLNDENPFVDTEDEMVAKAYQLGIVNGVGSNKFSPRTLITREQISVMLYNLMNALDYNTGTRGTITFSDKNEISSWALDGVYYVSANDILKGVGGNRMAPQDYATVEQALALMDRLGVKFGWYDPATPMGETVEINGFLVPITDTQIVGYAIPDERIVLRLTSDTVVPKGEIVDMKTQFTHLHGVLLSNMTDYDSIIRVLDFAVSRFDKTYRYYREGSTVIRSSDGYSFEISAKDGKLIIDIKE